MGYFQDLMKKYKGVTGLQDLTKKLPSSNILSETQARLQKEAKQGAIKHALANLDIQEAGQQSALDASRQRAMTGTPVDLSQYATSGAREQALKEYLGPYSQGTYSATGGHSVEGLNDRFTARHQADRTLTSDYSPQDISDMYKRYWSGYQAQKPRTVTRQPGGSMAYMQALRKRMY
jgi:hypothetical protein